ncbi:MAG: L,D-transpeptidase [Acidobacteria bacterium]|nr:L,D-transpeptidase [Acidobacteriota bacterium]
MKWHRIIVALFILIAVLTSPTIVMAEKTDMPPEVKAAVLKLETRFNLKADKPAIVVVPATQTLYLVQNRRVLAIYPVSTAARGLGNRNGSYKTPTGTHRICRKYGENVPVGTIFCGRKDTGKIAKIYIDKTDTPKDYVTTRILRLEGLEPGVNKGKGVDSYLRLIYIHGTPEEGLIGTPASHGCLRMKNADVIALFNAVPAGTLVEILANDGKDKSKFKSKSGPDSEKTGNQS